MNGIVFDLKKYAIHDGSGIRTTVFLKGCPLSCQWCHNPESINPAIQEIRIRDRKKCLELSYTETRHVIGKSISSQEIVKEVLKDIAFYEESNGGVTLSGGEPLLQIGYSKELLTLCRKEGLHTVVDTCGYVPFSHFEEVIPVTSLFYYDIKLANNEQHERYTGVPNQLILDNLQVLSSRHKAVEIRIPLIPNITDTKENMKGIIAILQTCPSVKTVHLLPYNPLAQAKYQRLRLQTTLCNLHKQPDTYIQELQEIFHSAEYSCFIGG